MFAVSSLTVPSQDWNDYVSKHPERTIYHRAEWVLLPCDVFGHVPRFLEARDGGRLAGVLPLVQQASVVFGKFMTSLPFYNYGGVLADSDDVTVALMEKARAVAIANKCSYVEFRDQCSRPGEWIVRTDKVGMVLDLPPSFEELARRLGSKLRSQVRRCEREAPGVRVGGAELLGDFYSVFACNMRDLGTPVYPRAFFAEMLRRFPELCRVLVITMRGKPVAAGLVVIEQGCAEIPWAACLTDAKPLGANMKLYWEVLSLAVQSGCGKFDFGRSTAGTGTHKFKAQWGATPVQLFWHRWSRKPQRNGDDARAGRAMSCAVRVWQRLPLRLANTLGPVISPALPW